MINLSYNVERAMKTASWFKPGFALFVRHEPEYEYVGALITHTVLCHKDNIKDGIAKSWIAASLLGMHGVAIFRFGVLCLLCPVCVLTTRRHALFVARRIPILLYRYKGD